MASHGTDQTIVQRLLAAKSERDSRRALLASGGIVLFQFTVFLLIGVLLYVFAQHAPLLAMVERKDRILPLFVVREMPAGMAGLVLASGRGGGTCKARGVPEFPLGFIVLVFFLRRARTSAHPHRP